MRYQSGAWDVRQDDAKSLEWLLKSANHGNRLAMQTLVHVYGQGELGVDPDASQSAYWQQRAAQIR
jgi:TPR repeat protein